VLDGAKTGKTVLRERYIEDRNSRTYGTHFVPPWKMDLENQTHQLNLSRGQGMPPFVMDVLREAMGRAGDEQLQRLANQFNALPKIRDQDLIAPWQDAEARAQEMLARPEEHIRHVGQAQQDALDAIKAHVARASDRCANLLKATATPAQATGGVGLDVAGASSHQMTTAAASAASRGRARISISGGVEFTHKSIERRQDQLRLLSREFVGGPPATETFVFSPEEVARLRASYAYLYDWTKRKGGSRFPWNVAMRELGAIKLRARQDFKPISQDFYEKMMMRKL